MPEGVIEIKGELCVRQKSLTDGTHIPRKTLREWEEQLESLKEQLSVRYERTVAQQFQRRLTSTQLVM